MRWVYVSRSDARGLAQAVEKQPPFVAVFLLQLPVPV
jgi:hypothetical protein